MKQILLCCLLTSLILTALIGCSDNSKSKTTEAPKGTTVPKIATTEPATEAVTEPVTEATTAKATSAEGTTAEETSAEETTAPPETSADESTFVDISKMKLLGFNGETLKASEASKQDMYTISFGHAYYCKSKELTYDTNSTPDLFDIPNLSFLGKTVDTKESDYKRISVGDKLGDLTVKAAEYTILLDPSGAMPMSNSISFEGTIQLTGYLNKYLEEDVYITPGDIHFVPTGAVNGFPIYQPAAQLAYNSTFWSSDSKTGIYSDMPVINCGNIADYKAFDFDAIFGDECCVKVTLTVSDINCQWSDQFGTMRTSLKIDKIDY